MKQPLPEVYTPMLRAPLALGPGVARLTTAPGGQEAEVYLYGDIGASWGDGITPEEFAKQIEALAVHTLNVRINSPGGVVFDGIAMYNALARHKAKVIVHIDGLAASIATVIAMAGDEIRIGEGAYMMIHRPWSMAVGDSEEMRKEAEILDKLESGIIDIYHARSGQSQDQLAAWMAEETWFGAQEAVAAGLADTLVAAKKVEKARSSITNSAMMKLFSHQPECFACDEVAAPEIRQFERSLRDGEGFSHTQAKRVAALANATFKRSARDGQQPCDLPTPALRDEGSDQANTDDLHQVVASMLSLAQDMLQWKTPPSKKCSGP